MINLLPPQRLLDIRTARRNRDLRRYLYFLLIGLVVLVAAVVVAYYFLHTQQTNTQKVVDINKKKVATLESVQTEAEELSVTVNTISALMSRNVQFSSLLTEIGGLMPTGSSLTGLQVSIEDLEAPLVVSADIDTEAKAAILRNNLLSSDLFEKANIVSIVEIKEKASSQAATQPSNNPYNYTVTINAFLKSTIKESKQ